MPKFDGSILIPSQQAGTSRNVRILASLARRDYPGQAEVLTAVAAIAHHLENDPGRPIGLPEPHGDVAAMLRDLADDEYVVFLVP